MLPVLLLPGIGGRADHREDHQQEHDPGELDAERQAPVGVVQRAVLAGDVGTSDFNFDLDSPNLPGVALYLEGQNNLWVSQSGTLTSAVSGSSQTCDIPLPLYAKSGHCNVATFDEQGSIVLNQLNELYSVGTAGPTKTLTIPHQTLHGLWMAVTEVQPIGLTAVRLSPPTLFQRLSETRARR